jgi:predicted Fe-Mo cluster-binding NifX family protein
MVTAYAPVAMKKIATQGLNYELIIKQRSEPNMKIAVISEDGVTISQHFGRAPLYVVITIENDKIVSKESRAKAGHHTFTAEQHSETAPGERHGYGAGAQSRHAAMAQSIDDCKVLIAGGMGWGAYDNFKNRGIETVVTDINDIDEAVNLYLQGKLPNLMERLH